LSIRLLAYDCEPVEVDNEIGLSLRAAWIGIG
jgi:hypothetical protein